MRYLCMNELFSKFFTTLRGESFSVDPSIPFSYLLSLALERGCDYLRGLIRFKRLNRWIFVGKHARIKCIKKIKCGKFLKISSETYLDGLSKNGVVLGNNFSLGRGSSIECTGSLNKLGIGFTAGNNVGIGSFSFLGCAGGITIGDDTITGNYVSMHSENHNYKDGSRPIRLQGVNSKGIYIGKNCWIGSKVTILDGAVVGDNSIIAAGAVVIDGNYEGSSIYGGIPARKIGVIE